MTRIINDAKMGAHIEKGACPMGTHVEAVKKYHSKLDEFKIRPYSEEGQKIREEASRRGMSVQKLFLEAVREYIANHPVT